MRSVGLDRPTHRRILALYGIHRFRALVGRGMGYAERRMNSGRLNPVPVIANSIQDRRLCAASGFLEP
jgi:hypothetical protein